MVDSKALKKELKGHTVVERGDEQEAEHSTPTIPSSSNPGWWRREREKEKREIAREQERWRRNGKWGREMLREREREEEEGKFCYTETTPTCDSNL